MILQSMLMNSDVDINDPSVNDPELREYIQ